MSPERSSTGIVYLLVRDQSLQACGDNFKAVIVTSAVLLGATPDQIEGVLSARTLRVVVCEDKLVDTGLIGDVLGSVGGRGVHLPGEGVSERIGVDSLGRK